MTPARLTIAIALIGAGTSAPAEPPGGPATTATQIGDTTYFSDGSRADQVGNVLYRSDGTTCTQVGERTECDAPRAPINAARPPSRRWPPTD